TVTASRPPTSGKGSKRRAGSGSREGSRLRAGNAGGRAESTAGRLHAGGARAPPQPVGSLLRGRLLSTQSARRLSAALVPALVAATRRPLGRGAGAGGDRLAPGRRRLLPYVRHGRRSGERGSRRGAPVRGRHRPSGRTAEGRCPLRRERAHPPGRPLS